MIPPGGVTLHRHQPDVSALFLPAERSFPLTTIPRHGRCVGSSNGWLAIDSRSSSSMGICLVNRLADGGKDIRLLPLPLRNCDVPVHKVVFAPNPTPDDYVEVAICDLLRRTSLAYTKTRDMRWMVLDVDGVGDRDRLVDKAYDAGAGKVYCVTTLGDVHVLRIPRGNRRRPIVERLQRERAGLPYDPAAAYAPPYDTASKYTGAKHVFFFGGNLYQVWRNTTVAVSWAMPGGGWFDMGKDEIFVLRYYPKRRPCWDVVKDLGGYSVFVGKNQPVVLRPEDGSAVRPNCVYWINEKSRYEPMVFDMASGTSTLYPSADKTLNPLCRPVCWYFLDDKNKTRL